MWERKQKKGLEEMVLGTKVPLKSINKLSYHLEIHQQEFHQLLMDFLEEKNSSALSQASV